MVTSSVGASTSADYYSGFSSGGSNPNTLSGSGLPTRDSINLQLDSSLLQSLSQPNTPVSSAAFFPTNIQQTVQDDEVLATDTNLAQMMSQETASSLALPTNIEQAAQGREILATNANLAQTISQQAASPLLEPLTAAIETLPATGGSSAQSEPSLTSLAASMQVLQNITGAGALTSNPSLTQSILQNYAAPTNVPSPGSLVDTSA